MFRSRIGPNWQLFRQGRQGGQPTFRDPPIWLTRCQRSCLECRQARPAWLARCQGRQDTGSACDGMRQAGVLRYSDRGVTMIEYSAIRWRVCEFERSDGRPWILPVSDLGPFLFLIVVGGSPLWLRGRFPGHPLFPCFGLSRRPSTESLLSSPSRRMRGALARRTSGTEFQSCRSNPSLPPVAFETPLQPGPPKRDFKMTYRPPLEWPQPSALIKPLNTNAQQRSWDMRFSIASPEIAFKLMEIFALLPAQISGTVRETPARLAAELS